LNSLAEEFSDETHYRAELARVYRDKAKVASRMRQVREAETAVRRSIEIFESLLAANRDSNAIRYELAKTLSTTEALGINSLLRTVRANELSSALLEQSPTLDRYKALKAHTLEALASHQMRERLAELAEKNCQEAAALYQDLIASSPELIVYRTKQAAVYESLAELKQRQNDKPAAVGYLQQAISSLSPPGRRFDSSMIARVQLQRIRNKLSRLTGQEQKK
jgi:tetratricopeptide (TPR) repeat protein